MTKEEEHNIALELKDRVAAFIGRGDPVRWHREIQQSAYYESAAVRSIVFPFGSSWLSGQSIRSGSLLTFKLTDEFMRETLCLIYKKGFLSQIKFTDNNPFHPVYLEGHFKGFNMPVGEFKKINRNNTETLRLSIPTEALRSSPLYRTPESLTYNTGTNIISLIDFQGQEPRMMTMHIGWKKGRGAVVRGGSSNTK